MTETPSTAVTLTDARFLYPKQRRDNNTPALGIHAVSITAKTGEHLAILGPNGSGKSTLLSILATARPPQAGTLEILNTNPWTNPTDRRTARTKLAACFQTPSIDPILTAAENFALTAAAFNISADEAIDRGRALLERMAIADRLNTRTAKLSGGQQRLIDLARALISNPSVLILDEPTAGLAPETRTQLREILEERRAAGTTIIESTHLTDEADHADRVVILNQGRVAAEDTPENLRNRIGHRILRAHTNDESTARIAQDFNARPVTDQAWAIDTNTDHAALLAALSGADAVFSFGPPTLTDAYHAVLQQDDAPAPTGATA